MAVVRTVGPVDTVALALEQFAAQWRFLTHPPTCSAIVVACSTGTLAELVALRAVVRGHRAVTAGVRVDDQFRVPRAGGLLPASHWHPPGAPPALSQGVVVEDARVGYDVVAWNGRADRADFELDLEDGVLTLKGPGADLRASVDPHSLLALRDWSSQRRLRHRAEHRVPRRLKVAARALDEVLDEVLDPPDPPLPPVLVASAEVPTSTEASLFNLLWSRQRRTLWPDLGPDTLPQGLVQGFAGIVREHLDQPSTEVLVTLVTDAGSTGDFFDLARTAATL